MHARRCWLFFHYIRWCRSNMIVKVNGAHGWECVCVWCARRNSNSKSVQIVINSDEIFVLHVHYHVNSLFDQQTDIYRCRTTNARTVIVFGGGCRILIASDSMRHCGVSEHAKPECKVDVDIAILSNYVVIITRCLEFRGFGTRLSQVEHQSVLIMAAVTAPKRGDPVSTRPGWIAVKCGHINFYLHSPMASSLKMLLFLKGSAHCALSYVSGIHTGKIPILDTSHQCLRMDSRCCQTVIYMNSEIQIPMTKTFTNLKNHIREFGSELELNVKYLTAIKDKLCVLFGVWQTTPNKLRLLSGASEHENHWITKSWSSMQISKCMARTHWSLVHPHATFR